MTTTGEWTEIGGALDLFLATERRPSDPAGNGVCAGAGIDGDRPYRTEKPWGHELLWAWSSHYVAKLLHIEAGHRLSLQYHRVKEETLLLVRGRLGLELEGPNGGMEWYEARHGQIFHIPPGRKHRLAALETCDVLEVSTPELEDLVRLQDDYGRE